MTDSAAQDRRKVLYETVGDSSEIEYIRRIVNEHEWKFAKTYAAFCPHEYTLRDKWNNRTDYNNLVNFIWRHGVLAQYGKTEPKIYWFDHESGKYYFIFFEDFDENGHATDKATLINRANISDFEFWIDEDDMVRCKTKPKRG